MSVGLIAQVGWRGAAGQGRTVGGAKGPRETSGSTKPMTGTDDPHRTITALAKPVVLVVEDDAATLEALRELLEVEYEVMTAADGDEALRLVEQRRPDLILTDVLLPNTDGLATLEALQRRFGADTIPVLLISGAHDEATVVRALDEGAADFVPKPVQGRELIARLRRALRQHREHEALEALAQTDALTGLANFRALRRRLDEELHRAQRYRYPLAAVMVDLDYLKSINDQLGHDAGNGAIVIVAEALQSNLREVDFAARFGGDEFVVLLPHQSAAEAAIFAERLRAEVNRLVLPKTPRPWPLSITVGVAATHPGSPAPTGEALLKSADSALYEAKRQGRNRVAIFSPSPDAGTFAGQ